MRKKCLVIGIVMLLCVCTVSCELSPTVSNVVSIYKDDNTTYGAYTAGYGDCVYFIEASKSGKTSLCKYVSPNEAQYLVESKTEIYCIATDEQYVYYVTDTGFVSGDSSKKVGVIYRYPHDGASREESTTFLFDSKQKPCSLFVDSDTVYCFTYYATFSSEVYQFDKTTFLEKQEEIQSSVSFADAAGNKEEWLQNENGDFWMLNSTMPFEYSESAFLFQQQNQLYAYDRLDNAILSNETVMTTPLEETVWVQYIFECENQMYAIAVKEVDDAEERQIYQVDLETNEWTPLYTYTDKFILAAYEGTIFLCDESGHIYTCRLGEKEQPEEVLKLSGTSTSQLTCEPCGKYLFVYGNASTVLHTVDMSEYA